jgi:pimeloyl-ACP methyl ester carboxylesterase
MLFAALYPDRVGGLVLVDPHDPEADHNTAEAGPPGAARESAQKGEASGRARTKQLLSHCVDLARQGALTPDNTDPYCLMTEADPLLKAELDRQHVRLQTKEAVLSEMVSLDTIGEVDYSLSEAQFREAIGKRDLVSRTRSHVNSHDEPPCE